VLGPGNDGYRLTSGPSASPANLGPSRVGSYVANQAFTNFRESVDLVGWNQNLDQGFGLAARLNNIGLGTSNGYYLHYNTDPGANHAALLIDRIDQEFPAVSVGVDLNQLDPRGGYRLVFTGIGSTLTGQIFALSDLNHALATLSATDSTYKSGLSGLLTTGIVGGANTGVDTTFDNFGVQAVPEPRGLAWALAGAVALTAAVRRRWRA
jgi:hypothetical protein